MGKAFSQCDTTGPWKPSDINGAERPADKPLDPNQIKTECGAYVWEISDMDLLERFLVLGSGSCYKANDKVPERKHLQCLDRLIRKGRGKEVVAKLSEYSEMGRTPRQKYIIFALAVCARSNDLETKKLAYETLSKICRIPTHLFLFLHYCKQESGTCGKPKGWGRAHRNAVIKWYQDKCSHPLGVARLLTKYKARKDERGEKWSHRDVFCLAHPSAKTNTDVMKVILRYVMKGFDEVQKLVQVEMGSNDEILKMLSFLEATEKAKHCTDEDTLVQFITSHKLEREHIPTQMMRSAKVCEALTMNMKPEAKLRNLCMISAKELCCFGSEVEKEIVKILNNRDMIRDARVHPFRILVALMAYEKGTGKDRIRSKNGGQEAHKVGWKVNKNVQDALYTAFEHSFINVQSTGKRFLLAINVSKSMEVPCIGCHAITCDQAAAAMVMTTVRTEKCKVLTFSGEGVRMGIKRHDAFSDILQKMKDKRETLKLENADCALPMLWARKYQKKIDVFIVYTDNVANTGQIHASEALKKYREQMKIPTAKLIVVAMASNEFTIADPSDCGMLDIVGFDSKATDIIAGFSKN